jgi:2-amino-4-hydroxy-6-hydroxymethyldihydropteridine diphosphokinase
LVAKHSRTAYLGLGSNVGDRLANLRAALGLLDSTERVRPSRRSSVYETEPVGRVTEQRDFYNAVVVIETELEPHELLDACKRVERELGRVPGGPIGGPRPIDVDLLLVDDVMLADERLVLPHPEVTRRRFVLAPLVELEPELTLPDGTSLAGALAALEPGQRVRRVGELAR